MPSKYNRQRFWTPCLIAGMAWLSPLAEAQVPQVISYEGRVAVDGVNFDSVTAGQSGIFRFALVNADGTATYWSNDGTGTTGSEPVVGVALTVTKGLYSVLLGDTAAPLGMSPITPAVFAHPDVRLRVWFDDGTHGSQLLSPDRRIASVAYAVMAGDIADGAVSSAKIATGAVGAAHIAAGAVDNTKLANAALTVTAGPGLAGGGAVSLGGAVTLSNAGVLSLAGAEGITVSAATGAVIIGSSATPLSTPGALVMRDASGDFAAGSITATLLGNATTATAAGSALTALTAIDFLGTLAGDVTGTQGATVVSQVGGMSVAGIASGISAVNAAASLNTPSALVLRDVNGNFAAGTITGDLLGNATTATTAATAAMAVSALSAADFTGALAGDVTGTQGATVVAKIGGVAPAPANTPGAVVVRDAGGNFAAGTVTAAEFIGGGAGLTGVPGTLPWQAVAGTAQAAAANTGYLANDAALVTVTLPAAAAVGDIVRVSGAGAGGWALVPGAGQSVAGFGAGLGPAGGQGAGAAVQYIGADQWQTMAESQLAAGTVQSAHIAPGAVGSAQLSANAVQTANIAAGAVDNTKLANAAVTVTAGPGLAGGGMVSLGGAVTLTNAGVLSVAGAEGITVSAATGAVIIGSTATPLATPGALVMRDASGDFAAGAITGTLLGNATTATAAASAGVAGTAINFLGTMAGDVTGAQGATLVNQVGGISAAGIASGISAVNAATNLNTPAALVRRDTSGNFAAGTITGDLLGNAATATTAAMAVSALSAADFTGALAGDVTGTQGATVGGMVGGVSAAGLASGANLANAAASGNVPGTIVLRNATGDISVRAVTATDFIGGGAGLTGVPGTLPWQTVAGTAQAAAANTGYLANDPALVAVTLPAAPSVGDIVRVSGVGAGGWALVPGAGQSVAGFGAGLGPAGGQGAGAAVQYIGADQWQTMAESQLAAGAVQSAHIAPGAVGSAQLSPNAVQTAHIAAGAVDNTKLANAALTVTAGPGLAGGGAVSLGGALTLSIPDGGVTAMKLADGAVSSAKLANAAGGSAQLAPDAVQTASIAAGAVDNTKLAHSTITVNAGAGLIGGGAVSLGGALTLSIPNGGVGAAQLAPGAAAANYAADGQSFGTINGIDVNQWLGTAGTPSFASAKLLNTGTGPNKPALVLDRGILPKGRVSFQRSSEEAGWSGLVLSINADWDDATGYVYDDGGRSQSVMQLEYEWLAPGGYRQNEFNWTSGGRRIWAHYCRTDDKTKAGVTFLAPMTIAVPETDTTDAPAMHVEGFRGANSAVQFILQNNNEASTAAAVQVVLRGAGSESGSTGFETQWYIGTDRNANGTNNFYILDGNGGAGLEDRFFIDPAGKVGIGKVNPASRLDVAGAVNATAYTVNGVPLQAPKFSLTYNAAQVRALGNSVGAGYSWGDPETVLNAISPFGGGDAFVKQPKTATSRGCIALPRTWTNGIQLKVRCWYSLKPNDTATAAPNNAVVLYQGMAARSAPLTSISQAFAPGWDLGSAGSGATTRVLTGGIAGEILVDERQYTIPANCDLDSRLILFGRYGQHAEDTEPQDLYFLGVTIEQL